MPDRPNTSENPQIVSFKISINDNEVIDSTYQITEIAIFKKINKINKADIHFLDGDVAEGTFPIMESNKFKPGTPIKIELGHGTGEENEIAFQGMINQVEVHTHSERKPRFVLKCVDASFKMTLNYQYLFYENTTDTDLFNTMIDRHHIEKGTIENTSFEHPSIVQFGMSDWDFLLSRSKNIGHIVYSEDGKLFVKKPAKGNTTLEVSFGRDIIKQQLSFTARSLFENVTAVSWNATDQTLREEEANEIELPQLGSEETATTSIASEFTDAPQKLLTHADWDTPVVSNWASGQLLSYELNKINGFITVLGTTAPKLDSTVEVLKTGNYFTGDGYISGIEHQVKEGKWTTKLSIGMKKETWYPAVQNNVPFGLQIGLVKQVHNDPAGNARILIELPGVEGEGEGIWARVLQRYASDGAGAVIYPEVGNEVVLGFLSNDPQSPIVLGSLFSQKNAPPFEIEESNKIKAFYSKEQLVFSFDEEKKEILFATPGGNKLQISDDLQGIRFEDQHGNILTMDGNGVSVESQSDMKTKTTGDIIEEATGNISAKSSSGDVSLEGMNIKSKANVKIEEKANIIESNATAQAVIKGGVVQIN